MGGRGSGSGLSSSVTLRSGPPGQRRSKIQTPVPPPDLQPGDALQTQAQASATLAQIASMTDDQLAQLVIDSKGVDMPNFLNDKPDATQMFVYQAGLNGAPMVVDNAQFQQIMQQNNIPQSQVLMRSVNSNPPYSAQQIANIFKYSELNYIGGKHGGMMSGAGTYFDMNGGSSTGYGTGAHIKAILNPQAARVVDYYTLMNKAASFARSHPKFEKAVGKIRSGQGGNLSIWALAMGYNVISGGPVSSSYYNIIDRSAVICVK